jgi:hypothetical protein
MTWIPPVETAGTPSALLRLERDAFTVEGVLDAAFMSGCWQRQPALIIHPPSAFEPVFGWPALNALLRSSYRTLLPPYVALFREGKVLDFDVYSDAIVDRKNSPFRQVSLDKLQENCAQGATLVLNAVERIAPPLQSLAYAFEDRLHGRPQFNLYYSPAALPCFGPHYDTQEVFVFQVEGRKRWEVWHDAEPHPLHRAKYGCGKRPRGAPEAFDLERGQLLYLPRGTWHSASALHGPSLHLTLALHRPTRLDFLQWLAGHAGHAGRDPAWRADLDAPGGDDALKGLLEKLAAGNLAEWRHGFEQHLHERREVRSAALDLPLLPEAGAPRT